MTITMYAYDAQYAPLQALPEGSSVNGKNVKFAANCDKPSCVCLLVKYTPGAATRTLTITIQVKSQDDTLTPDWYSLLINPSVALIGAGITVDSFTGLTLALPGHVSEFRLQFASSGDVGAADNFSAVLCGLPPTGVTIT